MAHALENHLVNLFAETFYYPSIVDEWLLFWSLDVIPPVSLSDR